MFCAGDRLRADISCGCAANRVAEVTDHTWPNTVQGQQSPQRVGAHGHPLQDAQPGDAYAQRYA